MKAHTKIGIAAAALLASALACSLLALPSPLAVVCSLGGFALAVLATALQLDEQSGPDQASRRIAAEAERQAVQASARRSR
jgi:hypothetical protein